MLSRPAAPAAHANQRRSQTFFFGLRTSSSSESEWSKGWRCQLGTRPTPAPDRRGTEGSGGKLRPTSSFAQPPPSISPPPPVPPAPPGGASAGAPHPQPLLRSPPHTPPPGGECVGAPHPPPLHTPSSPAAPPPSTPCGGAWPSLAPPPPLPSSPSSPSPSRSTTSFRAATQFNTICRRLACSLSVMSTSSKRAFTLTPGCAAGGSHSSGECGMVARLSSTWIVLKSSPSSHLPHQPPHGGPPTLSSKRRARHSAFRRGERPRSSSCCMQRGTPPRGTFESVWATVVTVTRAT